MKETDELSILPGPLLPSLEGTMNVCIGIATRGRPDVLAPVVERLRQQTFQSHSVIIACVEPEDVGPLLNDRSVTIVYSEPGLARQRNAILANLPSGTEIVVFYDDDFLPHRRWLEVVAGRFAADRDIDCITGDVVLDGIKGPGLQLGQVVEQLERLETTGTNWTREGCSPYGCNMAFRVSAIQSLRFDERLVLYGWLEDLDFGARIRQRGGRAVKLGAARGVHLGVKSGRVSGRRLGYSQIVNPVYLLRKGTMTRVQTLNHICRNVIANLVHSVTPEPYIDRRGRLLGNMAAFVDLLRGRVTPERAECL